MILQSRSSASQGFPWFALFQINITLQKIREKACDTDHLQNKKIPVTLITFWQHRILSVAGGLLKSISISIDPGHYILTDRPTLGTPKHQQPAKSKILAGCFIFPAEGDYFKNS